MNLKQNVLKYLEENRKSYISGEQLAELFGVSRSAVWKAIKKLREEGYDIEATSNKGYRLSEKNDRISAVGIAQYLPNVPMENIIVFSEVDSTNNVAKEMALKGAAHGTVILAERQTAGRGRMGRSFESPAGTGIYLTIIMRPDTDMQKALLITTAAAVGVCRAIRRVTGVQAVIKWVNDVYIGEKKVCGILTEAVTDFESGSLESVVTGIGINFKTPNQAFSEEARARGICSIYEEETPSVTRNQLAAAIIQEVLSVCGNLDDKSFLSEYREWSIVIGKEILYSRGKEQRKARVLDIGDDGGLIVLTADGEQTVLSSGEISVRLQQ